MANKINKKFILVVTGFVVAAAVLLVGAGIVYSKYVKDAERHIVAGDRLMAEGKTRDAYSMYGRALSKKPDDLRFVEKMESALEKFEAKTATQAIEDYNMMLQLKAQRTRAQPEDPKQWQLYMEALEDEAKLYGLGEGWRRIETVAKEMEKAVPADAPGAEVGKMYLAVARSHVESALTQQERADTVKLLQELSKTMPGQWRVWQALFDMQVTDAQRAGRAGQLEIAAARMKELAATVAASEAALAQAGPEAAATAARLKLELLTLDPKSGRDLPATSIDPLALNAALDMVYSTALNSGSGTAVRDASAQLASAGNVRRAMELLDEWVAKNPQDLRTRTTGVMLRGQLAEMDSKELPALRVAAKNVVDQPQLTTSLNARLQDTFRSNALSALLNAELRRVITDVGADNRAEALAELGKLRDQLLLAAQNDPTAPVMLAADAKLAHVKGDLPEAQRKWESYFAKMPAPSADAYLWAVMTARERRENGLALQYATKGSESFPSDLALALQRADLCMQLGRIGEAESLLSRLREVLPGNQEIERAWQAMNRRVLAAQGVKPADTESDAIQAAIEAKDYPKARQLVGQIIQRLGDSAQMQVALARLAMLEGDRAAASEIVEKALQSYEGQIELWRIKAELATEDPVERVEMMVKGVVTDPAKQAGELLNALRALRVEMASQESRLRGPDPTKADEIKKKIDALNVKIADAEKSAMTLAADDPTVIESLFFEAVGDYQLALQENRQSDAQSALARASAQLAVSRKVANAPELPVVLESVMLELQGQIPQALAMVEKARAAGRTEGRLAVRLANLLERVGKEPEAFEIWKDAYGRRPSDPSTVLGYARALGRQSKGVQALDILRQATEVNPLEPRLPLLLAQFETIYGSRLRAIEVREELAKRLQPIPENLAGLYALLYMPPSFDGIRGPDGKPLSAAQWSAMSGEQRGRYLSDTAQQFQARAEELYRTALKANPLDIGLAVQKARVMREQGRADEGTRAIQAVIDAAQAKGPVPAGMYLDLGIHLLGMNRIAEAEAAFAQARSLQDPAKREADLMLVEIEVQRGRIKEAAAALEDFAKANPRVEVYARLSELLLGSGDFERSQQMLEKAKSMAGNTASPSLQASFELLAAGVLSARAESADRAGNLEEGRKFREGALAALSRAETLQPNSLTAPLRRVSVLRTQAKSGGRLDPEVYAMAVAEADKLLARNAAMYEAAALRTALSLDRGDKQGAIGVLDRFLVAQPSDDSARSRLIQLYLETGNLPKAIAACRAASDLAPTRADWRERLGDLLSISGDHEAAGAAYERAFLVQSEIYMLLAKSMDERTLANKPDVALAMQQNAGPNAKSDPAVRAAQAVALQKQGKTAESLAVAREAITAARTAGIGSPAMQEVLPRLRSMFPPEKTEDMVNLILSTGTPNAAEKVLISNMWTQQGFAYADQVMKWADAALAEGDSVPAGLRAAAHTSRGNALYAKGDKPAAIKAFQQAAELESTSAPALNNAAYLAAEAGVDLERSLQYAERAVALAPETAEFLDTLGYVLYVMGSKNSDAKVLDRAQAVLLRSLLMAESPTALLHLGMTQAINGNGMEARKSLERAKKLAQEAPKPDADLISKIDEATKALK